jgi:hypothetical protein
VDETMKPKATAVLMGITPVKFAVSRQTREHEPHRVFTCMGNEPIAFEFVPSEAHELSDFLHTLADLVGRAPEAIQAAVKAGAIPPHAIDDQHPDPKAN